MCSGVCGRGWCGAGAERTDRPHPGFVTVQKLTVLSQPAARQGGGSAAPAGCAFISVQLGAISACHPFRVCLAWGHERAFDPAFQRGRREKANDCFPASWHDLPVREGLWFAWHSVRTASLVQPAQRELRFEVGGVGVEPQDATAAQGVAKIRVAWMSSAAHRISTPSFRSASWYCSRRTSRYQ